MFEIFKQFNLLKYIDLRIFLISFAIGMGMVYLTNPDKRIIYVYPTPETSEILLYRDKGQNCFEINEKEVPCPKNEAEISKIPPQS